MTLPLLIGLGLAGGFGALARFALDGAVAARVAGEFPFGTLAVNLTGALALGILVGSTIDSDGFRLAGSGFVGAYTTFSTWAFESHRLGEDGQVQVGALNFAVSLVVGVLVAWLGRHIGAGL
ncbi:MAG TPA: fluoride efflux transporter CrcB [Thermoleophilaceae bacterium]|nr:fluoride efflux transporter CrcB [Thermoleophilaceae bacterium]